MFTAKQSKLFDTGVSKMRSKSSGNAFTAAGTIPKKTLTGNAAIQYESTGNDFIDQFAKVTKFRELRGYNEISADMSLLWSQNKLLSICFLVYLRLITRVVSFFDGTKTSVVQRGQGLKHEGIFRMIWLAVNHPSIFQKNVPLFISVGSWKDIFLMLRYDLEWNGWKGRVLDWDFMGDIILAGLENDNTSDLVKKYLPQIKANKQCTTVSAQANNLIAKFLCQKLFGNKGESSGHTYKRYRKLKASGTAHEWQQLISQGKLLEIDFKTIHGRALSLLVGGKFLKKNGLEAEYERWLDSQPVLKYTGYVYELLAQVSTSLTRVQEKTINKQFQMLVDTAKRDMQNITSFLVIIDTSGSMSSFATGTKISCRDIAKGLALYFSHLLDGPFYQHYMEFSTNARLLKWKGETPVDMFRNAYRSEIAGTNFQSIATEFIKIKQQGVPESDFPKGILAISDGEFNNSGYKTNAEALKNKLRNAGFSNEYVDNLKIVIWDLRNSYYGRNQMKNSGFEALVGTKNVFYLSGFDGSIVSFITGKTKDDKTPETPEELFDAAMNQEVMDMIQV